MGKLRFSWARTALAAVGMSGLTVAGFCGFLSPLPMAAETVVIQRMVQGVISGPGDVPVSGAVVYLKDLKTLSIRSFISTADGSYRFGQMTTGADYELWADYKGKKSSVKTLSSFDNRKQTIVNLKVDVK